MFRIRRIDDDALPVNVQAIREVEDIFRDNFSAVRPSEIAGLTAKLRNPFEEHFRTFLYVAENERSRVLGFALVMHEPVLHFFYLDFLAVARQIQGRGIGAALYERLRDEALGLNARGVFFESLPDDPARCSDTSLLEENRARLRFYEQYGATPIVNTGYETPVKPDDDCLPHLLFDGLDRAEPLRVDFARSVVRAILERKYGHLCPQDYVNRVVDSFQDDPVQLAPFRFRKQVTVPKVLGLEPKDRIALVFNDQHSIHHIRERGYVQSPVRIKAIRPELTGSGMFETLPVNNYSEEHITAVHATELVEYLRDACASAPEGKSIYPYVFPVRNATRPPKDLSVRAGYYCIDTFTPINRNAFPAAKRSVDCVLTAADEIHHGRRFAYALVRPPGHHAEKRLFGGFCYFNNNAIAAHYLLTLGKVAILDLDYHHGNGQQDIFYPRSDVLTVSIHGDPDFAYPYFTGFADELGMDEGEGFNRNFPLPEVVGGPAYRTTLAEALQVVKDFSPAVLVVALGLDPAKGDPTGTWTLRAKDFEENGRLVHELGLPTLVVQEGGYRIRTLGLNARSFFTGLLGKNKK